MHKQYDSVVVGAGAGGLAMSLILAKTGRKVLLLEKSKTPGGALGSFYHKGFRLDAGFHFTGALQNGGIFDAILRILEIRDKITPIFLDQSSANLFTFTSSGKTVKFPYGLRNIKLSLLEQFPDEKKSITTYFEDVKNITDKTTTLYPGTLHIPPPILPEDSILLKEYLQKITSNKILRETLSALVMCHGTPPSEISFANHARLCQGFYESVATIEGGGNALVTAFLEKIREYDVQILCNNEIQQILDFNNKKAENLILSSGEKITFKELIFTISPQSIARKLPSDMFPPAFFKRISNFDITPGFFTVFLKLAKGIQPRHANSINSFYPADDIDALSKSSWNEPGALAIIHSLSGSDTIVTAFEPIYWDKVKQWEKSSLKNRPPEYLRWKRTKTEEIINRITDAIPEYQNNLKLITSATPLTYRDYLNHYHGAAYGIKQKVGQFNLIGPLRVRNIFVAGQSAILPGVLGTIMASLLVAKNIIGTEEFIRLTTLQD